VRALTTPRRGARSAFTMVETLIAITLGGMILGAIGLTVLTGKENFRQGVTAASFEVRARRALDRIVAELQAADGTNLPASLNPPLGASSLQFRVCTGQAAGTPQWSAPARIELVADPRDPADGVDNDNDGVVDDGRVVLVRDVGGASEQRITLVSGVRRFLEGEFANAADDNGNGLFDESGLSFVIDAQRTLTIRLSLECRDPRGQPMVRTVETAVHMRN